MNKLYPAIVVAFSLSAITASAQTMSSDQPPPGTIQHRAETMQWRDAPPSMPAGTKIMVLEGNPAAEGLFTMRLKIPAGTVLPPHWHPRHERVTVLSGSIRVGFGDVVDESATTTFNAGSFYVNPPDSHHYVIFPEETVMQMTGVGPWELHLVGAGAK
jgi:quercetin dioxygenase-like cupin family protein